MTIFELVVKFALEFIGMFILMFFANCLLDLAIRALKDAWKESKEV